MLAMLGCGSGLDALFRQEDSIDVEMPQFIAVCSSRTAHSSSPSEPDIRDDMVHSMSSVLLTVLQYPSRRGRFCLNCVPFSLLWETKNDSQTTKSEKPIDSHGKKKILDALEPLCVHKSCNSQPGQEPKHFLLTIAIQLCLKSYGRAAEIKKPQKSCEKAEQRDCFTNLPFPVGTRRNKVMQGRPFLVKLNSMKTRNTKENH